jgi:hypothetical protein
MLPGRPEGEAVTLQGGPPRFGPQQELDLGGGKLPPEAGRFGQKREQAIQVEDRRGHQLLRSFLVLGLLQRELGLGDLGEGAESRDHRQVLGGLELPRKAVRVASALDVSLQLPESLEVLPLQKAVLAHPDGFYARLGKPPIEGGAREAGLLQDLRQGMAMEGDGFRHGGGELGRTSGDVSGCPH